MIHERARFHQRSQWSGQSVESFVRSLYKVTEHRNFEAAREEQIHNSIVIGILDKHLSWKLQLKSTLTLDQAFEVARQSEEIKAQISDQSQGLASLSKELQEMSKKGSTGSDVEAKVVVVWVRVATTKGKAAKGVTDYPGQGQSSRGGASRARQRGQTDMRCKARGIAHRTDARCPAVGESFFLDAKMQRLNTNNAIRLISLQRPYAFHLSVCPAIGKSFFHVSPVRTFQLIMSDQECERRVCSRESARTARLIFPGFSD